MIFTTCKSHSSQEKMFKCKNSYQLNSPIYNISYATIDCQSCHRKRPIEKTVRSFTAILVGLDRTGHMSFPTGQDRTPKFAGHVLPDRTSTGPILSSKFVHMYGLSIQKGKKSSRNHHKNLPTIIGSQDTVQYHMITQSILPCKLVQNI